MALPIKPKDTQETCNPVSSNCVIWQGPDIPCINLCNGDSVSDVVAKMAERLCTITEQLDISLLDLSCFNPIYPTPQDFQDIIQLILNKVCALENPGSSGGGSNGGGGTNGGTTPVCPDDCIITIASCFQERDYLGNLITTLPLKDYVIKIGNELCSLITTVNSQNTAITDLQDRVTYIEDNCCSTTPATLNITTTGCIGNGVTQPIQNFLSQFETAFCNLQASSGNPNDANTALSYVCITGTDTLPTGTGTYNSLPGWINSPTNIAQSVQDLWLVVCNQNQAIINLQNQIDICCAGSGGTPANCSEIVWNLTRGVMVAGSPYWGIVPTFTGSIPPGWTYASGAGATVTITDTAGNSYAAIYDIINWINNPTAISTSGFILGTGPGGVAYASTHYVVSITLSLVNGDVTCTNTVNLLVTNTLWCANVLSNASYIQDNLLPSTANFPKIAIGVSGIIFSGGLNDIPTNYAITVTPAIDSGCSPASYPTLTGQFLNWVGPIGSIVSGANLPVTPWVYGSPAPAGQYWDDPGPLSDCIQSASATITVTQGDYPSITCTIFLEKK